MPRITSIGIVRYRFDLRLLSHSGMYRVFRLLVEPAVQRGQYNQCQQSRGDQAADHHDGQRTLHFGTGAGGKKKRYQTQHGNGGRHQHRAKPLLAALDDRVGHACPFITQLPYIGNQHYPVQYRNAP